MELNYGQTYVYHKQQYFRGTKLLRFTGFYLNVEKTLFWTSIEIPWKFCAAEVLLFMLDFVPLQTVIAICLCTVKNMCSTTVYVVIFEGHIFRGFHSKFGKHKILILKRKLWLKETMYLT